MCKFLDKVYRSVLIGQSNIETVKEDTWLNIKDCVRQDKNNANILYVWSHWSV